MKLEILIRTHAPDAQWLEWCLLSCKQRVPEIPVTVVCPIEDYGRIKLVTDKHGLHLNAVYPAHKDGYMDQQWTKLNADHFCPKANYIIHMDSDCIWTAGVEGLFTETEYGVQPLMLITPYADLGDNVPWKVFTEQALGFGVEYEYMRRMPLVFPRWIYKGVRDSLRLAHPEGLETWFAALPNRELSEFNVLGAWCDKHARDYFDWVDTSSGHPLPEPVMRQGWSWGGMTPEVKQEWRTHVETK